MSFVLLGILNSQAAGGGAAGDFELLETTTLASDTASVTFSGLGSYTDYKHLQMRIVSQTDRSSPGTLDIISVELSGDTTSSYRRHVLNGNGSSVSSSSGTLGGRNYIGYTNAVNQGADNYGTTVADFLDFSNVNKNTVYRSFSGFTNSNASEIMLFSGSNFVAEALTSLKFTPELSSNFTAGSRFSLYGIK